MFLRSGGSFARMARNNGPHPPSASQAKLLQQFEAVIAGMGSDELRRLLPNVLAAAMPELNPFAQTPPPSRRRARRDEVVTFRVRVDLTGTKPPCGGGWSSLPTCC